MSFLKTILNWIEGIFSSAKKEFLKAAVMVTANLNKAINSPSTDLITDLIPGNLDEKIVSVLRGVLPKILGKELAIVELMDATTEEELQAGLLKVGEAFGVLSDDEKAELYTTITAKMYIELKKALEDGKVTFGEAASLAESAYQTWMLGKKKLAAKSESQESDIDGDGIPDSVDPDIDGDGWPNDIDTDPTDPLKGDPNEQP